VQSKHIETTRLLEVVHSGADLDASELDHLKNCADCLEMMRSYVRQKIGRPQNQRDPD
jgi:hypothetical protein